ncbi:MAG TPA: SH3 domain-containing protein, partial [Noviherbaspirillum sp.]
RWLQVRDFENDEGWVYRSLTGRTPHHVVKVPVANIRSRPSTNSRIVGKAKYGNVLRTLDRDDNWIRIRSETGTTGWIMRKLLWGW